MSRAPHIVLSEVRNSPGAANRVTPERRTGWTARRCLSWWVLPQEGISSTHRFPYLEELDRVLANGRSHRQLSVWARAQLQVPLTRCSSGFTRICHSPTGLIHRGCRVERRRMGAPMVGLQHGLGISIRCPWLTLGPTSLGEDDTPRPY